MKPISKILIAVLCWLPMLAWAQPNFDDIPEVKVSAKLSGSEFVPGQRAFALVVLDHGPELHSWPSIEQDVLPPEIEALTDASGTRTEVGVVDAPAWLSVGPVQWPEPKVTKVPNLSTGVGTVDAPTYKERAIVYVPLRIADDAPVGEHEIRVRAWLQACDDSLCYIPQEEFRTLTVNIVSEGATNQLVDPDFDGFDAGVFDKAWSGQPRSGATDQVDDSGTDAAPAVSGSRSRFLGLVELPAPGTSAFLVAIAFFSAVGGFVLNLTPCVLPVIPIKVMTLTHHAGERRGRAIVLGVWMALGVVAFWSALSIPVLFVKGMADPSVIFGIWWLTTGIGLVILLMAAGIMGLFQIKLPQKAYMINPSVDSAYGSFVFGVMTAVLGLPCFGFVVGALLPAAATAGAGVVVTVFVSLGVGMALPYLVLSLFPGLLKSVPKTGPASELVKQVMGLLLMAAGAYFIGAGLLALAAERPYIGKVLHWWAAGLFVAVAGLWLVIRTVQITRKPLPRVFMLVVATMLGTGGIWVANYQTQLNRSGDIWTVYSEVAYKQGLADGKVVVLDFTAEWCLNCKALEAAVLNVDPVRSRLVSDEVVALKVDLTSRSAPGWQKLRELGQTGIPTLAVFGPGQEDGPWIANAYGPGQVMSAIEAAGGSGATRVTAR